MRCRGVQILLERIPLEKIAGKTATHDAILRVGGTCGRGGEGEEEGLVGGALDGGGDYLGGYEGGEGLGCGIAILLHLLFGKAVRHDPHILRNVLAKAAALERNRGGAGGGR